MNYVLLKKKGDNSTLRKVATTDPKPNRRYLGVVGTVDDLRTAGILEYYNGPSGLWCFLSAKGHIFDRFSPTRVEALAEFDAD